MHRISAVRSLKYSEAKQSDRCVGSRDAAEPLIVRRKGDLWRKRPSCVNDTIQDPSVLSGMIHQVAIQKSLPSHGIWCPMGEPFVPSGVTDVTLSDNLTNSYAQSKARKQLDSLVTLLAETQAKTSCDSSDFRTQAEKHRHRILNTLSKKVKQGGDPTLTDHQRRQTIDTSNDAQQKQQQQQQQQLLHQHQKQQTPYARQQSIREHVVKWRREFQQVQQNASRRREQRLQRRNKARSVVMRSPQLRGRVATLLTQGNQGGHVFGDRRKMRRVSTTSALQTVSRSSHKPQSTTFLTQSHHSLDFLCKS